MEEAEEQGRARGEKLDLSQGSGLRLKPNHDSHH